MFEPNNFSSMSNSPLSRKQSQQHKPIRICNCPCVAQIQQSQRMLQLQRQYTKTIQMQNLRRNHERISLETQVQHLRLQLQQPHKQRQQLKDKIRYFKKQSQNNQGKVRSMEEQLLNKCSQVVAVRNQLTDLKNQHSKLRLQNNLSLENAQALKNKLQSAYQKINVTLFKERKASVTVTGKGQDIDDILEKTCKKWQQISEEMQKRHKNQIQRLQAKHKSQIQTLQAKQCELQQQINDKNAQISQLINQNSTYSQKAQCCKKQIQSFELIKQNETQDVIQQPASTILVQKIHSLQTELIILNTQKQQWTQKYTKLSQTKCLQSNLNCHQQHTSITNNNNTQDKQSQTQLDLNELTCEKQLYRQLKDSYDNKVKQIQQKNVQLFKLEQRVQSSAKIKKLYTLKEEQLRQHRQCALLRQFDRGGVMVVGGRAQMEIKQNKRQGCLQDEQGLNQLKINMLFGQYAESAHYLKAKLMEVWQQLKKKQQQIICLEQVNSSLKKMKISSIDDSAKILALKRQNVEFKKTFGPLATQMLITSKLQRYNSRNKTFFKSGCALNTKSSMTSRRNQNKPKKSTFQVRDSNLHERSYLTHKDSDPTIKSIRSSDSQTPQLLLTQMFNPRKYKNEISNRNQQLNKLRRNDTFQSEQMGSMVSQQRYQRKKGNLCLEVPIINNHLNYRTDWEDKFNLQSTFQI